MNLDDLSTQLLYTTTRVSSERADGNLEMGTGFFFSYDLGNNSSIPLLVTNYHVVEHSSMLSVDLVLDGGEKPTNRVQRVSIPGDRARSPRLGGLDLVAIPFAQALSMLEENEKKPFYRSINQQLIPEESVVTDYAALEDITFIGYPSGISDEANKLPLIRRGITSTPIWNNYGGRPEFLVDAGVYPGSSGSPIFILNQGSFASPKGIEIGNRLHFVGIMTQTFQDGQDSAKARYLNLGIAINSRAFLQEVKRLVNQLVGQR